MRSCQEGMRVERGREFIGGEGRRMEEGKGLGRRG